MSKIKIKVPSLGESISSATVGEIYKKNGDFVNKGDNIIGLETDKATVDVPADSSGLLKLTCNKGDEIEVGSIIGNIDASTSSSDAVAQEKPEEQKNTDGDHGPKNSPAAEKIMAENKINPSDIKATGKDGRITKGDVMNHSSSVSTKSHFISPVEVSNEDREKIVPMSKLRKIVAKRLKDCQNTAAILTTFNEVDMTNVMMMRKKYKDEFLEENGVKLGFMSFFARAACQALHEIPAVNAEIKGDNIIYKNYCNMGVAVGTDKGLMVPVIRDIQDMSMAEIEKSIGGMAKKARDGKITPDDMNGGTFTITNGGSYGSLLSTPIINPPQSGILGMHNILERPMAVNGEVKIRPMMYLALSYDHRIIDGKDAVTFLVKIKNYIEDPAKLLLK